MTVLRIEVEHHVKQVVILDVTEDELDNMTYEDAIANCRFDEHQPSIYDTEILDARVNNEGHFFK